MAARILLLATMAATPVAGAQTIQPGEWQSTTRVLMLSMPNTPPELLKSMTAKAIKGSVCITAADAAAGPRKLFEASKGKCSYSEFRMSGGVIASKASCAQPGGQMTMASRGTYTATSYAIRSTMDSPGGMKMSSETTARRVGACRK